MAYFSNGSEGLDYESQYCDRCIHWTYDQATATDGCPVWDAHMLHNYDQNGDEKVKSILDLLIPMDGLYAAQCKLFVAREPRREHPR